MTATFASVVLGSPDPVAHAAFYRELLGWTTVDEHPHWVRLRSPEQERPGLSFQLERDFAPPAWPTRPDGLLMQSHLDVLVDDLPAEVDRAVSLGATVEATQYVDDVRVLRDPSGQLFCLFLAGAA